MFLCVRVEAEDVAATCHPDPPEENPRAQLQQCRELTAPSCSLS